MPKDTHQPSFTYEGFSSPNGTIVPDDVFDVLLPHLNDAELRVLLYIIRRTFGFKRERDNISLRQLVNGITTRDGRVLDGGAGLSKASAARGLKGLKEKGIIISQRNRSAEKGDEATTYALRFKGEPTEKIAATPVSQFETPPRVSPERHPRVSKLNTQQTVEQQTENISNIRMASTQNKFSEETTEVGQRPGRNRNTPAQTAPHQLTPAAAPSPSLETIGATIQRRGRGRPPLHNLEERQVVQAYIEDFARELGDEAKLKSSVTRALNLKRQAGLDLGTFIGVLEEARAITKERTASITKMRSSGGGGGFIVKNKMPYYFAVIAELLGLKDDQDKPTAAN